MATTSFTAMRRLAGMVFTLLWSGACLCVAAAGQAPLVVPSATSGLTHPTGWGAIEQTAIDQQGDWLVVDFANSALYEFPANGGPVITLIAPGGLGSGNNPGIAIDSYNTMYLEGNWSNCLLQFPYDPATGTWPGINTLQLGQTVSNNQVSTSSYCGGSPAAPLDFAQYGLFPSTWQADTWGFQPWGIAVDKNNNLWISNQVSGNWAFQLDVTNPTPADPSGTTPAKPVQTIYTMSGRVSSVAVDPWLNSYYVEGEQGYEKPVRGVLELTNAQYQAAGAGTPGTGGVASEAGLTNVAPAAMTLPVGVAADPAGNLYATDYNIGTYLIPNPSGTPNTAGAIQLTAVPGQGAGAVDYARHIFYFPTTVKQSNGQGDVAQINFSDVEFGASSAQTPTPATPVTFNFYGSVTPASFVIEESGMTSPDFAITGGTCTTGTAYAANTGCSESIVFTPSAVGSISAKLLMLDAKSNILSSIVLHGTGLGATTQVIPGLESTIGSGLQAPAQIATDAVGNIYVADPGQGKVLMYAAGSGVSSKPVSIGTGLKAPTGVAVDGAGDIFIADSGAGSVYEVPFGPSGLNAAGQVTLISSELGSGLNLAADGLDNLYIADPTNKRVVRLGYMGGTGPGILGQSEIFLTTGFNAPTAVAVDANGNLYVIDGANLFELALGAGAPTTLLNTLSGATGLAVDPSGAVYVSSSTGTTRIPYVSGALSTSETAIASDVTSTSSVALDRSGNIYLTQPAGGGVTLVSTNGTLNLGKTTCLTCSNNATNTLINSGNSALNVTGYTSTNSVDYTAADAGANGCEAASPLAAGGSCAVAVTFAPGPGEQGTLTGTIGITSNAVNVPNSINVTGVGMALANSTTSASVGNGAQVIGTPISVTVASQSGTGVTPSGSVTVSFTSWNVIVPTSTNVPTINQITATATANLNGSGQATFNLSPVLAGAQNITVNYNGDRVYGRSTTTVAASIAKSAIAGFLADPNPPPYLPFVLQEDATGLSGSIPYDGSATYWQYSMPVTVSTAAGIPTGNLTFNDNSSTCPPGTSATGQGAAYCLVANYSGVACPLTNAGVQPIRYSSSQPGAANTGATGTLPTTCLQMPQFTTYTPIVSTHYITPQYSGDANFAPATDPVSTMFEVLRSPMVMISSSPSSVNVQPGSTVTATLTLNSVDGYGFAGTGAQLNNYNFPVTLTCENLPPHAECTFTYPNAPSSAQPSAPNSVQILCSGSSGQGATAVCEPSNVTVTIVTNVSAGTTTSQNASAVSITLASIFGLGMAGLFFRRKAFEKARFFMIGSLMVVAGALAVSLSACNTSNLTPIGNLATPAGTFPVTIVAQQVGSQCIAKTGSGTNCITASGGTGMTVYGSTNPVSYPFYVNVQVQ